MSHPTAPRAARGAIAGVVAGTSALVMTALCATGPLPASARHARPTSPPSAPPSPTIDSGAPPATGTPVPAATPEIFAGPTGAPPGVSPAPVLPVAPVASASPTAIFRPANERGLVIPPAPALSEPALDQLGKTLPSGDLVGTSGPFVGVSSQDVVAMALARNTDLAVSQSNRRIAGYQIVAAQGVYDLRFELEPQYQYSDQAALSAFAAGPSGTDLHSRALGLTAGLAEQTGSGGTIRIQASGTGNFSDSTVNSFNDYYTTALGIVGTQPLLRGRAIDDTRRQIQLARVNADLSTDNALMTASSAITNALTAYNNLISAWKNVAIQEDALRQAKAQSESNARLVRRGAAAPVDVVESDTQVDVYQDDVYAAIQNVALLQNQLKEVILSDPADPIWTANLVPTTPLDAIPPEPPLSDVIVSALEKRPEVAQLRENFRNADVAIAYAHDQELPQVDLSVSATENGFAGVPAPANQNPFVPLIGGETSAINALIARSNAANPGAAQLAPLPLISLSTIAPFQIGNIGTSAKSLFQGRYPQINASVTLAFPIRNRTARADLAIAKQQRLQAQINEVALVERIQYEARNAVQSYRSARSRLVAARAARIAAERVYASELRKFRAGQSTTFLVLQRETELVTQRGRELQAQTDLQNALVSLDRVTGDVLAKHAVRVDALGAATTSTTPLTHAFASPVPMAIPPLGR